MKIPSLLVALVIVGGVAGYVYKINSAPMGGEQPIALVESGTEAAVDLEPSAAELITDESTVKVEIASDSIDLNSVDQPTGDQATDSKTPVTITSDTDVTTVAVGSLSDGDFNNLVADLALDPSLLPKLLEEYRSNTDPDRASRMAQVLKSRQDPRITVLGQEMVYSGDPQSQQAGFALLGGQQGNDPNALETVVEMIEIESNTQVLRSAMGALSIPGKTQDEQQERVLDQFSSKANHDDPMVRRLSLSLMSRWEGEGDMNEYYVSGLSDVDERVRTGALFSLKASNHQSEEARQALINVAQDTSAGRLLRLNAVSLLKRYGFSEQELEDLKQQVKGSS